MTGVKDQPEPPSRITRNRCQGSAGTVSNIRSRRNVEHHPKHDRSGGDERTRTADPLLAKQVLYQLSYVPGLTSTSVEDPIGRFAPPPRDGFAFE
jgi:hypothetical protein